MDHRSHGPGVRSLALLPLLLLLITAVLAGGCGSSGPGPQETLKQLAPDVRAKTQDAVDFKALLSKYTTAAYASQGDAALVRYRLFLTGNAADLALVQGKTDVVAVEETVSGETATVRLTVQKKEGLFAVAPVSGFTVSLVKGPDGAAVPWLIDRIELKE